MNGDLGKIYEAINDVKIHLTKVDVKQEERHRENKQHMDKLDADIDSIRLRPCVDHKVVHETMKRHDKWIWFLVTAIMLTAIKAVFF